MNRVSYFILSHLVQYSVCIVGQSREFTSLEKVWVQMYIKSLKGRVEEMASHCWMGAVYVLFQLYFPSCTFFSLKIMKVWIIVPLRGLKTSIRGIIHSEQNYLAALPNVFHMCSIILHIVYQSGNFFPPHLFCFIESS